MSGRVIFCHFERPPVGRAGSRNKKIVSRTNLNESKNMNMAFGVFQ
jgi:hypothetical protein